MEIESLQKDLFDKHFSEYEQHFDDSSSQKYRIKFMYDPLFQGIDLTGKSVLEAMCGSGQATQYLLNKGANVQGLDLCEEAINSFHRRWPKASAICTSIFDSKLPSESFDNVVVIGGLHHVQPHANKAIDEIWRVLKKGGMFCFIEPHAGSLPDIVRRYWYRKDPLFAPNEAAIDVNTLRNENAPRFKFVKEAYAGNLAYLLIYNSLIFRIPLKFKPFLAFLLMPVESLIQCLQTKVTSCYVICQWKKE